MSLTWEQSGDRTLRLTLQDVQQLAIDSGFVFPNTGPELPLARRANLSGTMGSGVQCATSQWQRPGSAPCRAASTHPGGH